jgi:hypothetical protein
VRHGDDRAGIVGQVSLEPGDALGIEVVRRLVQQQDVGPFQEDFAERDATPLPAGERGDIGLARGQAHRIHGDLDPAVEVPALRGLDRVLDRRLLLDEPVHLVRVDRLAEPRIDRIEPGEQGPRLRHGLLDIASHVQGGVERRLLRQVSDRRPRRRPCGPQVVGLDARHDAQQRALARAVPPEDANLGPRVERQPDFLEDFLLAERLGQVFYGENILRGHYKILNPDGETSRSRSARAASSTHSSRAEFLPGRKTGAPCVGSLPSIGRFRLA